MSANLSIIVYDNPKALMVPLGGVSIRGSETFVQVLKKSSLFPEVVEVTTGMTTLDSVEILNGLEPGDQIVLGAHNLPGSMKPAGGGGNGPSPGDTPGPAGQNNDPQVTRDRP
ncbi:hypothetical protein [Desulfobacter sp.]|uniref:hypothetical protein n=1 Tax=Desulfobacter sp. TaxID=2294 RepID=UPI003D0F4CF0